MKISIVDTIVGPAIRVEAEPEEIRDGIVEVPVVAITDILFGPVDGKSNVVTILYHSLLRRILTSPNYREELKVVESYLKSLVPALGGLLFRAGGKGSN